MSKPEQTEHRINFADTSNECLKLRKKKKKKNMHSSLFRGIFQSWIFDHRNSSMNAKSAKGRTDVIKKLCQRDNRLTLTIKSYG